jgi:tRNA A37 N6-isopentenylltransferase MiaA
MLAQGWQDEVTDLIAAATPENLRQMGIDSESRPSTPRTSEHAKPFDFIGYRELAAVRRGEWSLEQARSAIQQSTRRYAKRQQTWFRREQNVTWFAAFGDDPQLQAEVQQRLKRCSGGSSDPCL